jgi:hypothetical protein
MAKKDRQTRALTGPRQLTQMIPEYKGTFGASEFPGYKGWIPSAASSLVYYETYFDLSGYALDDLTALPIAAMLQDPGIYSCTDQRVPMQILDIISQERLDPGDVFTNVTTLNNVLGMLTTTNNFEQITFGNYRLFLSTLEYTHPITLSTYVYTAATAMQFGSGDPATVEKLYCYRFIITDGATTDTTILDIPASRFILNVNVIDEPDLEYIMRLKRSYELDQED